MATQSQNAFSDNALKFLVIGLALERAATDEERNIIVPLAGVLYAGPFLAFSMFGGWLADRCSKAAVMRGVKFAEIFIMLFAALALGLNIHALEYTAVFFMGCHSAIFGPSKYGILPEVLPFEKLSWGNGLLELLTFAGVILGMMAGGFMAEYIHAGQYVSGLILAALAFCGWLVSQRITHVRAADPTCPVRYNPVTDLAVQIRLLHSDGDLWRANWGNTGFWFVAALVQQNLVLYSDSVLGLDRFQNTLLLSALLIGIGIGSAAAGFLSRGRIEYGFVPLGALGMALSTIPMGVAAIGVAKFAISLVALGLFGGLFIVPIAAVLQHKPAPESKGAVQGAANLLSFVGIFAASGVQFLLGLIKLTPGEVFWFCGAAAFATGIYAAATRRGALQNLLQLFAKKPS
ncbi:MAG TPA: MFS transporter [Verrucomicrobiaceae bacterium]